MLAMLCVSEEEQSDKRSANSDVCIKMPFTAKILDAIYCEIIKFMYNTIKIAQNSNNAVK